MKRLSLSVETTLALALFLVSGAPGADDKKPESGGVPPTTGDVIKRLAFPNPSARLDALERELKKANVKVEWTALYDQLAQKDIDAEALKSDLERAQVLLGVRISDSMVGMMAKDTSRLRGCAQDIKALAHTLSVDTGEFSIDRLARALDKDDWNQVFYEVGDLQQIVVEKLDSADNRSKGALIAAGAWLQGMRYACKLVSDNHAKVDLSNFLRSAPIADLIGKEIKTASPDVLAKPTVKASLQVLAGVFPLLNIGRNDNIPKEKVDQIFELATSALQPAAKP